MDNRPETADIETASDGYATRFSGKVGEFFLQVQLEKVLQFLENYDQVTILDVGGGHAQLAVPLAQKGYPITVTGSDDSCSGRLRRFLSPDQYAFTTCNMLALPFADNSFDIVLAFRLLPHVDKWQLLADELCRVAKIAVIIDYPDLRSSNILNSLLFRLKKKLEGNTRPFGLFTRKQIAQSFGRHNFLVVKFAPEFFLPMVVHRKIDSLFFSKISEKIFRLLGITALLGSPVVVHLKKQSPQ